MSGFTILACALVLDAIVGEPRALWSRVPHPAVVMGRAVGWLDARLNTGTARRAKGAVALLVLCIGGWIAGATVEALGGIASILVVAVLLAQRSLMDHAADVARGLRVSLGDGRRAVAHIVGRDTAPMDGSDMARATLESAAENFSDAVIAPAFWFLVAGVPGIVVYKCVNTADSMIGYRTDRHRDFGWASARLDDVLNWLPARLSAGIIALAGGVLRQWRVIAADAGLHRSPNAGWPESALARAIGVALAGPRAYHGARVDYPFINPRGARQLGPRDIDAGNRLLWRAWGAGLIGCVLLAVVIG